MENKYSNDNEDPWRSIGLQAALIVNKLRCAAQLRELTEQEKIEDKRELEHEDHREKDAKAKPEYVEQRLREIAAWEKRIGGGRKP